jgi:hypothetical protein
MTQTSMNVPAKLRARVAADFDAVRPLPSPLTRALWVAPFALLALLAAPLYFNVRSDAAQLGWAMSWGASLLQVGVGFLVVVAALRESIPGRGWNAPGLAALAVLPIATIGAVTLASWQGSEVVLQGGFWFVGLVCLGGSASTAFPVIAIANVLAARAYPTRPAIMGALLGLGAGLMADAGWRMFCHFSEPAHVLPAHAGGVIVAVLAGSALAVTLRKPFR